MAIDATTFDSTSAARTVQREPAPSLTVPPSRDSEPVEIKGDMSFWDFLDVINPLQHLPIIGTIYREITGDTIQPAARVMGGILFGGPLGAAGAVVNAMVEQAEGKDIGDQVMSALGMGGDTPSAGKGDGTAVAAAGGLHDNLAAAGSGPAAAAAGAPQAAAQAAAAQGAQGAAAQAAMKDAATKETASSRQPDQPIRLFTGSAGQGAPAGQQAVQAARTAAATPANTMLAAQLAGQDGPVVPHPTRMPARDTNLANTMQAKHAAAQARAPLPGSATPSKADAARPLPPAAGNSVAPVSPEMLSETMMRNLAKYEQTRKAAGQGAAAPAVRVSG
ncbi:hypothetical protein [Azospirillum thermophilum]|uniref:Uncharacterized protein n=1 Tax=Azospirillum thermophilum TaxID=2202148 RepID=A0A2S2CNG0_9PROT|nr:hypothetical protein [Azospirillum thermophilum]AWK86063.1 hypothetical protein DEW08_07190 [Azospirillum thermophilum]